MFAFISASVCVCVCVSVEFTARQAGGMKYEHRESHQPNAEAFTRRAAGLARGGLALRLPVFFVFFLEEAVSKTVRELENYSLICGRSGKICVEGGCGC